MVLALTFGVVGTLAYFGPFFSFPSSFSSGPAAAGGIALVNTFALLNGFFASIWPGGGAPQLAMGYGSIIAAHTLFSMALVIVIVRARIAGMDRSLIEASMDLYADPWGTFRQVTLPQLMPAIVAGLHKRGLRPVTIPRLLLDDPPPHGLPVPTSLAGD